jgi:Ser/Thr protein kinase RdoA (MazF antagonist)
MPAAWSSNRRGRPRRRAIEPARAPVTDPRPQAFAGLTPDVVLDALDAVGFRGDGRILQLNSYENRVFQVMLEEGDAVVAKFYRPARWSDDQIVEEHRFALELEAAEVPVVAPCVLTSSSDALRLLPSDPPATLAVGPAPLRYAVAPRRAGRAPELEDDAVLQRLGGFIGRLHDVGARRPFAHRRTMLPAADARSALALLADGDFLPPDQIDPWTDACERAIELIDAAFARVKPASIRLHGDCHPGNLLWRDSGAHVVDLDDACMGPAVQDLWMLLSGEASAAAHQLQQLLVGYRPFRAFDRRELQLVEPLRLLRMIRHNAWVAQRWHDPAFPAAFPDFGSSSYWAQQVMQLREQMRAAQEGPRLDELF